ncbi:MAG: 2OG-Fe(II) oxygenase [Pseudomonadota bacterium]
MPQQRATDELRRWVAEQRRAGQSDAELLSAMRAGGWQDEAAREALKLPACTPAGAAVPRLAAEDGATQVDLDGQRVTVLCRLRKPDLSVVSGLLSAEECESLIALARPRLARSETVDTRTGASEVNAARTSEGMFFQRGENPLCAHIEQRIARLLDWPVDHGEGLQVLRYRPGAEYKPHYDYFDPAHPGTPAVLRRGGQRVATVVMYLSTPTRGGATVFPDVGLEVQPVQGHAVCFSYAAPEPGSLSLHGGAPIIEGEKWVATKWLRERRFD